MLLEQIHRFIHDAGSGDFNELALKAFQYQYERLEAYRNLCTQSSVDPETIADWRQVPVVPTLAFKNLDLSVTEGGEIFRSSGTTGGEPSVHRHGFLDLYRSTIDHSFPDAFLGSVDSRSILSLIPARRHIPDSSLSFMAEYVLERWGAPDSLTAIGPDGIDARQARSFLSSKQREGTPVLVLSTAFSLVALLEALARLDLRFRMPTTSMVFETGGYKGRSRELSRRELAEQLHDRLGISPDQIVREYGMTELTSQFYTGARLGGDPDLFLCSHWTRVRILDPETLVEAPTGKPGLIAVFDLANLSSAVHLLTQDLGVAEGPGFRLLGRAAQAELRGCSLAVEELTGS